MTTSQFLCLSVCLFEFILFVVVVRYLNCKTTVSIVEQIDIVKLVRVKTIFAVSYANIQYITTASFSKSYHKRKVLSITTYIIISTIPRAVIEITATRFILIALP